jgi:hypothetical protein
MDSMRSANIYILGILAVVTNYSSIVHWRLKNTQPIAPKNLETPELSK